MRFNSKLIINSSYSKGYYAYKNVWHPIVGDESLICEQEKTNEYDRNAVPIMFDDCISKKVVQHVPFNWSKLAPKIPAVSKLSYLPRRDWKANELRCWIWPGNTS